MNSSGVAASVFGLHPNPVGTPDELRQNNLDPTRVGCCAPEIKGQRKGCPYYAQCIFQYTKNGGFRDQGPRNVGFFHETHEGHRRQEFMACFTFMQTMYQRMRSGIRDREDGLAGEVIRIVAQEGGFIRPKLNVNANEGKPLPHKWVRNTDPKEVPAFPRPHQHGSNEYDAALLREEDARRATDPDLRVGPPVAPEDMEPEPEREPIDLDAMTVPGSAPVAAPVAKKPK